MVTTYSNRSTFRGLAKRTVGGILGKTRWLHERADRWITPLVGSNHLLIIAAHLYGDEPESVLKEKIRILVSKFELLPLSRALEQVKSRTLPARAAVVVVDDLSESTFVTGSLDVLTQARIPFAAAPIPGLIADTSRDTALCQLMRVASREYSRDLSAISAALSTVIGRSLTVSTYSDLFTEALGLTTDQLIQVRERLRVPVDSFGSWDDLRRLRDLADVEFVSHSMSHPLLKNASGSWLQYELGESKRRLESKLGVRVNSFAYPVGGAENATKEVTDALRAAGYGSALLVQRGTVSPETPDYHTPRVGFEYPIELFNLMTSKAFVRLTSLL